MQFIHSQARNVPRLMLAGIMLFSLSISIGTNADPATFGVLSSNESDRPPVVNPDIATRSTDPDRPPAYGPEDAPVLIVLFSDYKCPHCRRASQATHQISAEYPGKVRIEIWHHPLSNHPEAKVAAAAAIAAQRQGKFWEMHDRILLTPRNMDPGSLEGYAKEIGLDMDQFQSDMNDPEVASRIQHETDVAEAFVPGRTPIFLVNGKIMQGWASWKYFRTKVGQEVRAANTLAAKGLEPSEIRYQRALDNNTDSLIFEQYRTAILEKEG